VRHGNGRSSSNSSVEYSPPETSAEAGFLESSVCTDSAPPTPQPSLPPPPRVGEFDGDAGGDGPCLPSRSPSPSPPIACVALGWRLLANGGAPLDPSPNERPPPPPPPPPPPIGCIALSWRPLSNEGPLIGCIALSWRLLSNKRPLIGCAALSLRPLSDEGPLVGRAALSWQLLSHERPPPPLLPLLPPPYALAPPTSGAPPARPSCRPPPLPLTPPLLCPVALEIDDEAARLL